jgi:hypothetical protein
MNNAVTYTDHTVAVYKTHYQAEEALKELNKSGYDLRKLSIIGQNYETKESPIGFINAGDRMLSWGKFGAFWGTIWGLLFGSGMLLVPGIGYVFFAGWIVAAIEGALVGGGLAALGGALASIGIPRDSAVRYESELKSGSYLLLAHGNDADAKSARDVLANTSPTSVDIYTTKQHVGVY